MRITRTVRIDKTHEEFLDEHPEYNLSGICRTAIDDIMANQKDFSFKRE